jgi:predicted dehydrogenase
MIETRMTRREFLSAATVSAAALATPGTFVQGAEQPLAGKPAVRLGFLGASHSHALGKLAVALSLKEFEFVGVCEESAPVQEKVRQQGARVISRDELMKQAEVVAVESSVERHATDAIAALSAGKHVHLEKPPGSKPGELEELLGLARRKSLLVQTGYMWRYHPGFLAIFEAVQNGWLGKVFMIRGTISNFLAPERRPEWGAFKGGSLFELGSHLIDVVVRLMGEPKKISPHLRHDGEPADHFQDNNVAVLEFDRAIAIVTSSALQKTKSAQRVFEVQGTRGAAILKSFEPPEMEIELLQAAGPYKQGVQKVALPAYERYGADLKALAAAVRGEGTLAVSPEMELKVQNTLLAACLMS